MRRLELELESQSWLLNCQHYRGDSTGRQRGQPRGLRERQIYQRGHTASRLRFYDRGALFVWKYSKEIYRIVTIFKTDV